MCLMLCLRVASFFPHWADLGFPFMGSKEAVIQRYNKEMVLRCLRKLALIPTSIIQGKQRNSGPVWLSSLTADLLPDG